MRLIAVIFTALLALQPVCLEAARVRHKKPKPKTQETKQEVKHAESTQAEISQKEEPTLEPKPQSKFKQKLYICSGVAIITLAAGYYYRTKLVTLANVIAQKLGYDTSKKPLFDPNSIPPSLKNDVPSQPESQTQQPSQPIRPTVFWADQSLKMAFAVGKPEPNDIKKALEDGANPDLDDDNKKGLFHKAIEHGSYFAVLEFIKHDVNINRKDGKGKKPIEMLHKTEKNADQIPGIIDLLFTHAITQNQPEVIQDLFMHALISMGEAGFINNKYIPTNYSGSSQPHTALYWAQRLKSPHKEIVQLLTNAGAIAE